MSARWLARSERKRFSSTLLYGKGADVSRARVFPSLTRIVTTC